MISTRVLKIAGVVSAIAMMLLITTVYGANNGGGHRGGKGMRGGMPGERIEKLAEKLNLSDAQKSQIKAIQEQFKSQNASTIEELKTLHETARQQMKDKNREGAQATREQMKAKKETLKAAGEQMSSQIRNVLTAEQQAKFDEMKQNHQGKCGGRKGKSGDRGARGQGETGQTPMNQNGQGTLK